MAEGLKPAKPYLYEFLWRGRHDATPPAWHVSIEARVDNGHGKIIATEQIYNVEQAKKAGWDIEKIGKTINFATLAECDRLRAELAEQGAALQALEQERDDAKMQANHHKAELARASETIALQKDALDKGQALCNRLAEAGANHARRAAQLEGEADALRLRLAKRARLARQ